MLQLQLYCTVAPPTAWKHTGCSLWCYCPVKTIFIKCLKELKRLLSEKNRESILTTRCLDFRWIPVAVWVRVRQRFHMSGTAQVAIHGVTSHPQRTFDLKNQNRLNVLQYLYPESWGREHSSDILLELVLTSCPSIIWHLHQLELPAKRKFLSNNPGCKSQLQ